ncbi:MAG: hypothetical protein N3D18_06635 [Roseococcus sp.]|nr:hypothetical protein [Roseococcus sp.]
MEGALLYGLAMAARSAALGSAAFLLLAGEGPLTRRVTMAAGAAALLLALAGLPATQGWAGWMGALGALGAAGGLVVLAWRGAPAWALLAMAALLLPAALLQAGVHDAALPFLGTLLREAGAALWMGSLPLLWFALAGEGATEAARRWTLLALGGMALALPGVLIAAGEPFGSGALPTLIATLLLLLGLAATSLWLAWRARAGDRAARLRPLGEAAILLALALCGPIAALLAGQAGPALWPALPAAVLALALLAGLVLPVPGVVAGAMALALAAAGLLALGAGAALAGVLAVLAGTARWLAWRGAEGGCETRLAEALWAGLALALPLALLLARAGG